MRSLLFPLAHALTEHGRSFYMELDKNIDFMKGEDLLSQYNFMYHVNVVAGSSNTKTELWLTTQEA
jgi:hypothetical protein